MKLRKQIANRLQLAIKQDIMKKKEVYRNMIADKIKNARTIKKLTQEQVAEDLNVSRQTISNWENGV